MAKQPAGGGGQPPAGPQGPVASTPPDPPHMRRAASAQDEEETREYYDRCRGFIVREDELIHQRLTWLITLQGFLFGAYGFSMSAQASSLSAEALKLATYPVDNPPVSVVDYLTFKHNLDAIRYGLIYLGIFLSFASSLGVIAAYRAIRNTASTMRAFPTHSVAGRLLYPIPIGRLLTSVMGMICGLLVPLLTAGIWVWIGGLPPLWWYGVAAFWVFSAITVFMRIQVALE